MLICLYLNNYFDIAGETWEIQQKLAMFNEFRLIVNYVRKSNRMSNDFGIVREGIDIFTHYKQTYFFFTHLNFKSRLKMIIQFMYKMARSPVCRLSSSIFF